MTSCSGVEHFTHRLCKQTPMCEHVSCARSCWARCSVVRFTCVATKQVTGSATAADAARLVTPVAAWSAPACARKAFPGHPHCQDVRAVRGARVERPGRWWTQRRARVSLSGASGLSSLRIGTVVVYAPSSTRCDVVIAASFCAMHLSSSCLLKGARSCLLACCRQGLSGCSQTR